VKYKLIPALVASMFAAQTPAVYADATQDLIDALVTKGVLTEDEGALLGKGRASEKKSEGSVSKKLELVSPDGKSTMKVSGRVQLDFRHFTEVDDSESKPDTFDLRRAYLGVDGKYNEFIGYKVNMTAGSSNKLDEAYLNLGYFKPAQFMFGIFKTSMSLEARTSSRFVNFTERSYVNLGSEADGYLTTGKQQGVQIHGTPTKGLNYSIAAINGYGQNVDMGDAENDNFMYIFHADTDLATMNKWKGKVVHLGASYATQKDVDLDLFDAPSQHTIAKGATFFESTVGAGITELDRNIVGLEAAFASGPWKIQAEYAKTTLDSNVNEQDISASYVDVAWLITGENYSDSYKSKSTGGKFDRIKPNSNFNPENGKGIGAWEVALGYSKFDASDIKADSAGYTLDANMTNEADSWRAGLKWILDPNTRIMLTYVATDFEDAINATNDTKENAINIRTQFDF
jgi:phosphate-selective porin OprO/OprP